MGGRTQPGNRRQEGGALDDATDIGQPRHPTRALSREPAERVLDDSAQVPSIGHDDVLAREVLLLGDAAGEAGEGARRRDRRRAGGASSRGQRQRFGGGSRAERAGSATVTASSILPESSVLFDVAELESGHRTSFMRGGFAAEERQERREQHALHRIGETDADGRRGRPWDRTGGRPGRLRPAERDGRRARRQELGAAAGEDDAAAPCPREEVGSPRKRSGGAWPALTAGCVR